MNIDELLELARLISRRRSGLLSETDEGKLQTWKDADPANQSLLEELLREDLLNASLAEGDAVRLSASADRVYTALGMEKQKTTTRQTPVRWLTGPAIGVAAASIIVILLGGYWAFFHKATSKSSEQPADAKTHDVVAPRGTRATLTIGNGQTILLDTLQNGLLIRQGNTRIAKLDPRQLTYQVEVDRPAEILYNTLTTGRGGQTSVVLPDGTRVWLNAESSLRFPTAFAGNRREVELKGEGYFEVVHKSKQPFRVHAGQTVVEDLGTRFDVNAYPDEPLQKTILFQGAVTVDSRLIHPGEEAAIDKSGNLLVKASADEEEVLAWKDGNFEFNRQDLGTILRQVCRWYDVEVDYGNTTQPIQRTFSGIVSRSSNLSEVLKILASANIRFRIEDKKIILLQ